MAPVNSFVRQEGLSRVIGAAGKVRISLASEGKANGQHVYVEPRRLTDGEQYGMNPADNLIIEGDNLQVMISLLPRYEGKVQIIYIDPPYNTGQRDFRYHDNWNDDDGPHTKWLKFMSPRLKLLRRLLSADGVIFVSIDDRELFRLGLLMDELFGQQNKVGIFVWHSKRGGGSDGEHLVTEHEYILCYARNVACCKIKMREIEAQELDRVDEHGPYRRGRELNKWGAASSRWDREKMWFPIPGPGGVEVWPIRNDGSEGRWRWGARKLLSAVAAGDVEFEPRGDGTYIVYERIRTNEKRLVPYRSILTHVGTYAHGTKLLKEIMGGNPFKNPKPVDLVKYLIQLAGDDDCLVLDSFAGSGTTGHAVLAANHEDGGCRSFILIETGNGEDRFCTTLTVERMRRVIAGEWAVRERSAVQGKRRIKVPIEPLAGGFTFKRLSTEPDPEALFCLQREDALI